METDIKLNYDDVSIVPEIISSISSRADVCPYDENGYLPIFASCMSTVVSINNSKKFNDAKIYTVIPRNFSLLDRVLYMLNYTYNFVAFSLEEAKKVFIDGMYGIKCDKCVLPYRICIDLAQGHMQSLLDLVKQIKSKWGDNVIIMTGNIANPETYREYEKAGVDYVRCTIGSGNCCLTASNVGVFYPPFSLLKELYEIKKSIGGKCKIIADGGIHGFRDIQVALIYADYVMIGSLFNKAIESAGKTTYGCSYFNIRGHKIFRPIKTLLTYGRVVNEESYSRAIKLVKKGKLDVWKEVFGMSTKKAQSQINAANGSFEKRLKTSEGLIRRQKVEYSIGGWAENETDYLRSAMGYTNSTNLNEHKDSLWVVCSQVKYNK